MGAGFRGIDDEGFSDADWRELETITVAQAQSRIDMRNAQFGHPLAVDLLTPRERAGCPLDPALFLHLNVDGRAPTGIGFRELRGFCR